MVYIHHCHTPRGIPGWYMYTCHTPRGIPGWYMYTCYTPREVYPGRYTYYTPGEVYPCGKPPYIHPVVYPGGICRVWRYPWVYIGWYMPGMGVSLGVHRMVYAGYMPPWCILPYTTLGIPLHPTCVPSTIPRVSGVLAVSERRPWALVSH